MASGRELRCGETSIYIKGVPGKVDLGHFAVHVWVDGVRRRLVLGKAADFGSIHISEYERLAKLGRVSIVEVHELEGPGMFQVFSDGTPDFIARGRKGREAAADAMNEELVFGQPGAVAEMVALTSEGVELSRKVWDAAVRGALDAGRARDVIDACADKVDALLTTRKGAKGIPPEVLATFRDTLVFELGWWMPDHERATWLDELCSRHRWLADDLSSLAAKLAPSSEEPNRSLVRVAELVHTVRQRGASSLPWLDVAANRGWSDVEAMFEIRDRLSIGRSPLPLDEVPSWVLVQDAVDENGVFRFTSVARALSPGADVRQVGGWATLPANYKLDADALERLDLASRLPVAHPVATALLGGSGRSGTGCPHCDVEDPYHNCEICSDPNFRWDSRLDLWSGPPMSVEELATAVKAFDNSGPFAKQFRDGANPKSPRMLTREGLEGLVKVVSTAFPTGQGDMSPESFAASYKEAQDLDSYNPSTPYSVAALWDELSEGFIQDPGMRALLCDYPEIVRLVHGGDPLADNDHDRRYSAAAMAGLATQWAHDGVDGAGLRLLSREGRGLLYGTDRDLCVEQLAAAWPGTDHERVQQVKERVRSGTLSFDDVRRHGPQAVDLPPSDTNGFSFHVIRPPELHDLVATQPVVGVEWTGGGTLDGNIDPQHAGTSTHPSAVVAAFDPTTPRPPAGAALVTVRPDLDAFGAMAVAAGLVQSDSSDDAVRERVYRISDADQRADLAKQKWAPRTYDPTPDDPALSALSAEVKATRDPADAVKKVAAFINDGHVSDEAVTDQNQVVERRRREAESLAAIGTSVTELDIQGHRVPVASVQSTASIALDWGYSHAPIVVATNPSFSVRDADPIRKHTVALHPSVPADFASHQTSSRPQIPLAQLLNEAEVAAGGSAGWGPAKGKIVGSPQGVSSRLSNDQVNQIVADWMTAGGMSADVTSAIDAVMRETGSLQSTPTRRLTLPGER